MARDEQDDRPGLDDLGELVRRRRESLPTSGGRTGVSIKTAAGSVGISHITWQRVESGRDVRRLTYSGVESALGWAPGSVDAFLEDGTEPTLEGEPASSYATPKVAEVAAAAAAEVPSLLDATHDELLAELRRRLHHLTPSQPAGEQRRHLAEASSVETAESVEARGAIPGLPMDEDEGSDAATGGHP